MKLHFSIPAAEELREGHGGRYVVGLGSGWVCGWVVGGSVMALTALCLQLYSLFLEGFLLGKARYRQLRRWDEQVRAGIQPFPLSLLPWTPLPLRKWLGKSQRWDLSTQSAPTHPLEVALSCVRAAPGAVGVAAWSHGLFPGEST